MQLVFVNLRDPKIGDTPIHQLPRPLLSHKAMLVSVSYHLARRCEQYHAMNYSLPARLHQLLLHPDRSMLACLQLRAQNQRDQRLPLCAQAYHSLAA